MSHSKKLLVGLGIVCALARVGAFATDPPSSATNPQSGQIETADPVWSGSNYDIRYVVHSGVQSSPDIETVSSDPLDDRRPRLAHASTGDAWVSWWRDDDTDRVLVRKRNYATGTWLSERTVSDTEENSRNPFVVHDGSQTWVVYEEQGIPDTDIVVSVITDEPDPIEIQTVATTENSGAVDVMAHVDSGRLWITWVDSNTDVGWSEYDDASDTWSLPAYESYASDDVTAARARIRQDVPSP
jgi:hypothetical protein